MIKVTVALTDKDIEAKELVIVVEKKGQAQAIKAGVTTANAVKAEQTKAIEL